MRHAAVLLAALALASCGEYRPEAGARAERREQRQQLAREHVAQRPAVIRHQVDGHQMLVVDLPVSDHDGLTLARQQCFVWRDAEFRVATMACPSRDVVLGTP